MRANIPKGMGGGPQNMNAMIRQAQKMQEDMAALQEDLDAREYDISAGGGVVGVKINGISGSGYMWFHNGGDDTKSLILVTALDDVELYVRTYNSTAVTFTNTSRGGISAIRIK